MTLLKIGSRGPEVRALQVRLKATGDLSGRVDGIFGPLTDSALRAFQRSYPHLTVDGVYGPASAGALSQALLEVSGKEEDPAPSTGEICSLEVWEAWQEVSRQITGRPVKYGPGRGAYSPEGGPEGSMMVTLGIKPGMPRNWKPGGFLSFHCSSWTNFFCGWVYRLGEEYTGTGNMPPLWDVLETTGRGLYQGIPYQGYGPNVHRFEPDRPWLTSSEIWSRRGELSSFVVWAQSTRTSRGWRWWHHTGLFAVDHRSQGRPVCRVAADGWKSSAGYYSGTAMRSSPLSESWATSDDTKHRYRLYCLEGLETVSDKPLLPVTFEEIP